ncbi:MAG: diguanylate cyclase [Anaerolineaceae bacterium]|nr:diguanylate cyclase [Anaerolineaceae bacterium]
MNAIGFVILLGLAGLLFILAAGSALQTFRLSHSQSLWIILAAAYLGLAALLGVRMAALLNTAPPEKYELTLGILALGSAALALWGTYMLGKSSLEEERSKKAAQQEAERHRLSFEKSSQMIVIKNQEGEYIYSNPAYNKFLGKKDFNLAGENDAKFFPRAQAAAFHQEEEKAIETGQSRSRDEEIHGSDGVRWLRITRTPLVDEKNSSTSLLVSGQDITEQKQAEESLRKLEQDLNTLYEAELALSETINTDGNWESVLSWSGRLAGTQHSGIWQVIPERSIALLKAGRGKLSTLTGAQIKVGEDIVWKVWQSGQAELFNDYQNWPERGKWARESGFAAVSGLPLKVNGRVAFVLTVFYDDPQNPREDQARLLALFAQMASSRLQTAERLNSNAIEIEDWKRKHESLQYRHRIEQIIAVLAAHFITIELENIDEGITRSLQMMARVTGMERCYLVLLTRSDNPDPNLPVRYSSWKNLPEKNLADLKKDEFQWYMNKFNQLETIHFPHVKDLSPEQEQGAAFLQAKGIKSFTAIPLVSNRSVIGYLAFEAMQNEMELSPDVLALLKTCAEMFVNLLERKLAIKKEHEAREKINSQMQLMDQRNQESALMTEMADLLQACRTADEAYPIIIRYIQRLIPLGSGVLYMIHDAKDPAEQAASWGSDQPGPAEHELVLNECWAMRRGRIYVVDDPTSEPVCSHIKDPIRTGYMCVPLIAQGVAVGDLHLRLPANSPQPLSFSENQQRLASKISEYIAVPLTNLKLRDELRSQAICDPLTKLYNRRYMEETLEREIRRATRHSTSVGIIMFDIDKMKPINDRYGHDAGDLLLRSLGREMLSLFRGEDVACRYGGDEFTIVLSEASLADTWRRAEQLREAVKKLDLKYEGKPIGPITLSIGVAAYPDHGLSAERVLLASDAASYTSKSEGGDRISMGHKVE